MRRRADLRRRRGARRLRNAGFGVGRALPEIGAARAFWAAPARRSASGTPRRRAPSSTSRSPRAARRRGARTRRPSRATPARSSGVVCVNGPGGRRVFARARRTARSAPCRGARPGSRDCRPSPWGRSGRRPSSAGAADPGRAVDLDRAEQALVGLVAACAGAGEGVSPRRRRPTRATRSAAPQRLRRRGHERAPGLTQSHSHCRGRCTGIRRAASCPESRGTSGAARAARRRSTGCARAWPAPRRRRSGRRSASRS